MKKIVKLTESDLNNLVKKVIEEQAAVAAVAPQPAAKQAPLPSCLQFKKFIGEGPDTNIGDYMYPVFEATGGMTLYGQTRVTGRSDKGEQITLAVDKPFCKF
jgi:hypothetical protein